MKNGNLNRLAHAKTASGEVVMEMFGPPNALTQGADSLAGALYVISETLLRGIPSDEMRGFLGGEFGYGKDYENDVFLMHPDYQDAECDCGHRAESDEWVAAHPHAATCPQVVYYAWLERWRHILDLENVPLQTRWAAEASYCRRLCGSDHPVCNCGRDEETRQWHTDHDHTFRCKQALPNFWHKASGLTITWYKWIGRDMTVKPELDGEQLAVILSECWLSIPEDVRERAAKEHDEANAPEVLEDKQELQADLFKIMMEMDAKDTPCWSCSRRGHFGRTRDGKMIGGRMYSGQHGTVAYVMKDVDGKCVNCGHITSDLHLRILKTREDRNNESMRKRWNRAAE